MKIRYMLLKLITFLEVLGQYAPAQENIKQL